jgi:predicted nuclease of predicted toxin-antitoxin system
MPCMRHGCDGGRKDYQVASYAIDNNMILVTNDMSDFRRIYKRRRLHPGIVFLAVMDSGIMDREAQAFMFEAALENVEEDEPINEAVQAQLDENEDGDWLLTVTRYPLPRS